VLNEKWGSAFGFCDAFAARALLLALAPLVDIILVAEQDGTGVNPN